MKLTAIFDIQYLIFLMSIIVCSIKSIKLQNAGHALKSETLNLMALSALAHTNSTNAAEQINLNNISTDDLNKGSILIENSNKYKAQQPTKFDFDQTFITRTVAMQNDYSNIQLPPEMTELKNIESPTIIRANKVPNAPMINVPNQSQVLLNAEQNSNQGQLHYASYPINNAQTKMQVEPILNPVPIMTHYNMPVLHHIPINTVVKKYVPVYYPIPVEHRINIPVRVPIKIPQKVLIPQAVPYGVKVPVPFPVRVEVPQYKEIEIKKPVYVKIPIYEHIPIYHHFAVQDSQMKNNKQSSSESSNNYELNNNRNQQRPSRILSKLKKKSYNQKEKKHTNEQNLENVLNQSNYISNENVTELSKLKQSFIPNQNAQIQEQNPNGIDNNDNQLDQLIDSLNCDKKAE